MSRKSRIDVANVQKSFIETGGGGRFWGGKEVGYETEHTIRILPALDGQPQVWLGHAQHWANRAFTGRSAFTFGEEKHVITCERQHGNGQCAVCEIIDWGKANGQNTDAIAIEASYYLNIIIYPGTKQEEVKVFNAKISIVKKLETLLQSKHWGGEELFDEKTGHDFDLIRHGAKNGPVSSIKWDITPHPRSTAITIKDWEDRALKLADLIEHRSYAEQVQACRDSLAEKFPLDEIFGRGSRSRAVREPVAPAKSTKKVVKKATKKR